jgi:hypothetical protein
MLRLSRTTIRVCQTHLIEAYDVAFCSKSSLHLGEKGGKGRCQFHRRLYRQLGYSICPCAELNSRSSEKCEDVVHIARIPYIPARSNGKGRAGSSGALIGLKNPGNWECRFWLTYSKNRFWMVVFLRQGKFSFVSGNRCFDNSFSPISLFWWNGKRIAREIITLARLYHHHSFVNFVAMDRHGRCPVYICKIRTILWDWKKIEIKVAWKNREKKKLGVRENLYRLMILAPIIVRKSPEQVKECRRFHLARKLSYRHMIRYGISDPVSNVLVRATPNLKTAPSCVRFYFLGMSTYLANWLSIGM